MEERKGEYGGMINDYFAESLLEKLDTADPVFAAFEAQDVSRGVGFDFVNFQDVVPRALDEIRETKEAFEEKGAEGREHFGDEIADIMFSLVNLARHAGLSELPTLEELKASAGKKPFDKADTIKLVDDIGGRITRVAEVQRSDADLLNDEMKELLQAGMEDTVLLAIANGFQPDRLLIENVRKYLVRCKAIEKLAAEDGKQWADLASNDEIVAYWKKAKELLN